MLFPKRSLALLILLLGTGWTQLSAARAIAADPQPEPRQVNSFDASWRFVQSDPAGAEAAQYDDTAWQVVDVPHDWSIAGPIREDNPSSKEGGFFPTGVAWYRKSFELPLSDKGRKVFVEFDGVMANSDVWINGHLLGHRPYGYVSFQYELTDHLQFGPGAANVIAVRTDTSQQPSSRWYEGAGIYRHVRLVSTHPIHLAPNGVFITTPSVSADLARVHVQAEVLNRSASAARVSAHVSLLDWSGQAIASADTTPEEIPGAEQKNFQVDFEVKRPQRWDLATPWLYQVVTEVRSEKTTVDRTTVPFGIREFRFEPATGFWINGRNIKIKGVCLHQDAGAVGIAVPLSLWERRLEALKALGVNAVRTAHNPMAPEFLDLCDRLGLLVLDEMFDCWTVAKNPYDYHLYFEQWSLVDTRDTVRRDRNHPSIFAYSAGNEIHDTPDAELAKRILASLVRTFHENDPSRPVTQALFRPNVSHDYDNGLADLLDVVGQNYREREILAAYRQNPSRKILGTENGHEREMWLMLRDNPPYAGQFLWPGIAYLGESGGWPTISRPIGLLDRTGEPYPRAFERRSWWSEAPSVFIVRRIAPEQTGEVDPGYGPERRRRQSVFADWTPKDSAAHRETVEVYSNAETVELFLNGTSLGTKPSQSNASPRSWTVDYAPGVIEAVARDHGTEVARHSLRTAAAPAKLGLTVDRKDLKLSWDDVAVARVSIVDTNGTVVPNATDLVTFAIDGPGKIIAVDNNDNASHEPFVSTQRHAHEGRCIAIIRATSATGRITLRATAPGLAPATATLR